MTQIKVKNYEKNGNGADYLLETDVKTLAVFIQDFFNSEGYQLEDGTPENGGYTKGNLGMRVLFGGFANRFKFNVSITSADGMTSLKLMKGMTGASGGLIGYTKMENEINRIREKIYNSFSQ